MQIRPATTNDVLFINDIDATVESADYLHVDRGGEGLDRSWRLARRPLRERVVLNALLSEELTFTLRQITSGADEGLALLAEHDDVPVALMLAQADPVRKTLRLLDLRVDSEHRRQGLATALVFAAVNFAREQQLRAVFAESSTDNFPAAALLTKSGFELSGVDDHRNSNHDLVKEAVTLFWYAPLD